MPRKNKKEERSWFSSLYSTNFNLSYLFIPQWNIFIGILIYCCLQTHKKEKDLFFITEPAHFVLIMRRLLSYKTFVSALRILLLFLYEATTKKEEAGMSDGVKEKSVILWSWIKSHSNILFLRNKLSSKIDSSSFMELQWTLELKIFMILIKDVQYVELKTCLKGFIVSARVTTMQLADVSILLSWINKNRIFYGAKVCMVFWTWAWKFEYFISKQKRNSHVFSAEKFVVNCWFW